MVGTYNGWLVVLSVVVAIVASYVALDLASRCSAWQGHKAAWYWQTGGAISQGSGIWSMHFVGMLAFRLPIPMSYDVWITLLSLILPILASGYGLHAASRGALNARRLVMGGVLIGIGIVSMHYTGMAAMKMQPPIRYEPLLVSLSILIAVAASVVGLWSAFKLRLETILSAFWKKAGSALVMGAGISGMHYTGMAAAIFAPNSLSTVSPQDIDDVWLSSAVGGFSLLFMAATLLISAFDAYRAERAAKLADGLRQAHSELEARVAERTAELARTNQALLDQIAERNAANEQIRALSRHLVEAQESQRKELSRELHDRVGQNLTGLDINLNILKTQLSGDDRAELRSRLEDSISLVGSIADAIENVMSELRPPMLNDHGLLAALHWYAKEFSQRTGIDATVRGKVPQQRLAQEIEITLFRIAQEALNNVSKHARATRVELDLQHSGDECILSVSDNGIGFDPAVSSKVMSRPGRGMVTMRERAQAVGGQLEIKAAPGGGTQILVWVPC
jgi:NO-binding membrane sensor protein with MHYT domain/two-component sensor histidine kinase